MIGTIRDFRTIGCGLAILLFSVSAYAADIRAVVDRTTVGPGESVQLTVSISGGDGTVDISPIRDFRAVSNGSSTSVQIINGQMSREVDYTYTLIPLKEGRLQIPSLTVKVSGTDYRTDGILVNVTRSSSGKTNDSDIYTEDHVSDPNPYEGQQIIYTFRLLYAIQVANPRFQKPEFSGFTAKEIENNRKIYRTVQNGREYNVTELTYVLVPQSAGTQTIDPATLECDVVTQQQPRRNLFNPFDDPFFGQMLGQRLDHRVFRSEPLSITVKPLPPFDSSKGQFSGLVGSFDIQAEVDKTELKEGESATMSVTVSGNGNIMDEGSPEIAVPDAFRTYKDAAQENIQAGTDGFTGKKIFRTALVPVKSGTFTIKPVSLTFFDISTGSYQTKSTAPFSIKVTPSSENYNMDVYTAPGAVQKPLKKQVEFTGRDILPLKEDPSALESLHALSMTRFGFLLLLPALVCMGIRLVLALTLKDLNPSRQMAERAERAMKDARDSDISAEEFLSCLSRSLISTVLSKAGVRGESLTYAEVETILAAGGFSESVVQTAVHLLGKIDSAKFSGGGIDSDDRKSLLAETRELMRDLSK